MANGRMMIVIQPSPVKYQLKTTEITRKLKKENCENLTYVTNHMPEIQNIKILVSLLQLHTCQQL